MTLPPAWKVAAPACLAVLTVAGYLRLELDMDLFSLLPEDSPQVAGLALYQEAFGASQELVISLRSADADVTAAAAESLAAALRAAGVADQVLWQSPLQQPRQIAGLVAFLWFNQPPEQFREMTRRFTAEGVDDAVRAAVERMASSLDPAEVARLSGDPFQLTSVIESLSAVPGAGRGGDPLVSRNGRFRILLLTPPSGLEGFSRQRAWTGQVGRVVDRWLSERDVEGEVSAKVTGNAALMAESGSGLLHDIRWAAVGTLAVVALLFYVTHRSFWPLLKLIGLLVGVLGLTLGLGGLLLGRVNIVSLGFATILLGLAADYGLILHQELRAYPDRTAAAHFAAVAPAILWAAVTTAGAFFMLTRSSLPGVEQLGVLVGLGVLTAAGVMLAGFLGFRRGAASGNRPLPGQESAAPGRPLRHRAAWTATVLILLVSSFVVVRLGPPAVDAGADELAFRQAPAREALLEVERETGQRSEPLWIMVAGETVADVSRRLDDTERLLEQATERGVLSRYALPAALWPDPELQRANRDRLRWLAERADEVFGAAGEVFTPDSLVLTEAVFAAWSRMASAGGVVWPQGSASEWVLRQFASRHDGRPLLLGRATPGAGVERDQLMALASTMERGPGADLLGWSLLSDTLLGAVQRDVMRVLIPMAAVLLALLAVAFRRFREMFLSLAVLGLSVVALLAWMRLAGWHWNLMNVMALALLLGTAVDYSIHVQYALRRHAGCVRVVRATVGRAILLCGLSTAAGFGTLGFASNAGLASLGRVCAVGIVIACLVSVYLLPAWWTLRAPAVQAHER